MCHAYLEYYGKHRQAGTRGRDVNNALMGAFTTDPGVVQLLFEAGIPVWWVRHDVSAARQMNIVNLKRLEEPKNICLQDGAEHGDVIHRGLVGPAHQEAMVRGGHTYHDLSRTPLLVMESPRGYPAAMTQQEYKQALGLLPGPSTTDRTRSTALTRASGGSSKRQGRAGNPCELIINGPVGGRHGLLTVPLRRQTRRPASKSNSGIREVPRGGAPMDATTSEAVEGCD